MKQCLIVLLGALAVVLIGCGAADSSATATSAAPTATAPAPATLTPALKHVLLTAEELNFAISEAISDGDNTLLLNLQITVVENQILVSGDYFNVNGEHRTGALEIALGARDGVLSARITTVGIEDFDNSEERMMRLNERLASALTRYANRDGQPVTVEAVSVTSAGVEMTLAPVAATEAP